MTLWTRVNNFVHQFSYITRTFSCVDHVGSWRRIITGICSHICKPREPCLSVILSNERWYNDLLNTVARTLSLSTSRPAGPCKTQTLWLLTCSNLARSKAGGQSRCWSRKVDTMDIRHLYIRCRIAWCGYFGRFRHVECRLVCRVAQQMAPFLYPSDIAYTRSNEMYMYRVAQKLAPFLYALTLPNSSRVSKLFHC